ncbi:MAG: mechanosensitive ion channel family protein [Pseudomonadota bacterium]
MSGSGDVSAIFRSLSQANLIQIGLIVASAWMLIAVSTRFLPWLANKVSGRFRFYLLASVPVLRLVIIVITLALISTHVIEPTIENLVALLGALGLALGFAFKDYISSLIAGVVTLYEAPYRPGDWIEVNGAYGEVKSINMRSAEIVTPDDTVVVIPHLKLWDQLIFNANDGGQNLQCAADFYLHPRHDAAQVNRTLHDVALTSAFLHVTQPISLIVKEKPWATHYRLKAYPVDPRQQFHFITDLTLRGKTALATLGVDFAVTPPFSEMGS